MRTVAAWRVCVIERGDRLAMRAHNRNDGRRTERSLPEGIGKRAAGVAARDWEASLNAGESAPSRVRLSAAVEAFELHLDGLRTKSADRYRTALNTFTRWASDPVLEQISPQTMAAAVAAYAKDHKPAGTAAYSRHLKAFFRWCVRSRLLSSAPHVPAPKVDESTPKPAVLDSELVKILATVEKIRPDDSEGWTRAILLCRHAGLRIGEAVALRWESGPVAVCRVSGGWRFQFQGSGQKSGKIDTIPATPAMAGHLDAWRTAGCVPGERVGETLTARADNASTIVGEIFEEAGVDGGAHGLRRAFCTEWASRVSASDLRVLARHSNIATTLKFYVSRSADELASRLEAFQPVETQTTGKGEFLGESQKRPAIARKLKTPKKQGVN